MPLSKKLPKSADSHVNPKRARRNLEDMFPEHWKLEPVADKDSNIEYGDDWIVKVTTDANEVSGAAFYVQSKVKEQKGRVGRRIGIRLKPSTLNYLYNLMLPVLMHCYNPINETGYWMWLSDYCAYEGKTEWTGSKELTVYIPTANVLNLESVSRIRNHVLRIHRQHLLQKNAQISSQIDPNFGYEFRSGKGMVGVGVYSKHPKAVQEQPIKIFLDFDSGTQQALQKAAESGDSLRFQSNVRFSGIPTWLLPGDDDALKMDVLLWPHVPDTESHLCIIFHDQEEGELFRTNRVGMRLKKSGTKVQVWEGKPQNQPIVYTIIFNGFTQKTNLHISYDVENRSAVALDSYFTLLSTLKSTRSVSISNLDLDDPPHKLTDFSLGADTGPDGTLREFVSNLVRISNRLQTQLNVPNSFDHEDLAMAQAIAELLDTGMTHDLTNVPQELIDSGLPLLVSVALPPNEARSIFVHLDRDSHVEVGVPMFNQVELLGKTLEIGVTQFVCYCTHVLNEVDVRLALDSSSLKDDTELIPVALAFDVERSYAQLLNEKQ